MPLNIKQQEAVDCVVNGHNLLITGCAGTGKSYVISEIVRRNINKRVAVTATTGLACSVILNACTIHRWSGIGDGRFSVADIKSIIKNNAQFHEVRSNIMNTDTLIIDECSMLSKKFFESLNEVCKLKNDLLPFGGIQIVLVGDFRQLPPVPNPMYNEDGEFCFTSSIFEEVIPHRVVLTEVIRQSDQQLVKAVSEAADGQMSDESIQFIYSLKRPLPDNSDVVKLFPLNDQVDDCNRQKIIEFSGDLYQFDAVDLGDKKSLHKILAPKTLWLKKGAPVILLKNLSNTLVNGLQGHVCDFTDNAPVVEFHSTITSSLTTVKLEKTKFSVFSPIQNKDMASRTQFPIKLSFAVTIHKSQGLTLERVDVDCRQIFKPGQLGVALGRVRHSDGLRVVNFNPKLHILLQPQAVRNFFEGPSTDMLNDRTCCRTQLKSSTHPKHKLDEAIVTVDDLLKIQAETANDQNEEEPVSEEFDSEFDELIRTVTSDEISLSDSVHLPEDLKIQDILSSLKFENVVTTMQFNSNSILAEIDLQKFERFCKNEYLKNSSLIDALNVEATVPVSSSKLSNFYTEVHAYQISAEFRLRCLTLFEGTSFTEENLHICFKTSNYIRKFLMKKKSEIYQPGNRDITMRQITDASKARVRYVGGYVIAKLHYRYQQKKKANMYKLDPEGQSLYSEAASAVALLDSLKVAECVIASTTNDPGSLLDIKRRQNQRQSLTNIPDDLFSVFMNLTKKSLGLFTDKNLSSYGSDLFQFVQGEILNDGELFTQFASIVTDSCGEHHDAPVEAIFKKLIKLYLMVLLNQFRKDLIEHLKVKKKMAHRKQIQVSDSDKSKISARLSQRSTKRRKTSADKTHSVESTLHTTAAEISGVDPMHSIPEPEPSTSEEPVPSTSEEPVPSTSEEPVPCTSSGVQSMSTVPSSDSSEEDTICKYCKKHENLFRGENQWVQCDSCNSWIHRQCANLQHHMKWKKVNRKGSTFFCEECKSGLP